MKYCLLNLNITYLLLTAATEASQAGGCRVDGSMRPRHPPAFSQSVIKERLIFRLGICVLG